MSKTLGIAIPKHILQKIILRKDFFPGNPRFPLLIYKQVFNAIEPSEEIYSLLKSNDWLNPWLNSIYNYHHYHSNTHEVLIVMAGNAKVQFGGESGVIYPIADGDVIIIPAGVAHKSLTLSNNFSCIGAYPLDIKYDLKKGQQEEYACSVENIKKVDLPAQDPIFGKEGLLFKYWQ